jgi:Ala-tRNA(Pro) deacylase
MPVTKLKKFLDGQGIRYVKLTHSPAYTAQEIAAAAHVRGRELAKTIVVLIDGRMAMAVLPAKCIIDFDRFRKTIGAKTIELAAEAEFRDKFPDCEVGAMPPFGNLYGMEVFVEESLREDKDIVFNACSHVELIRLSYADFERLVKPKVLKFS